MCHSFVSLLLRSLLVCLLWLALFLLKSKLFLIGKGSELCLCVRVLVFCGRPVVNQFFVLFFFGMDCVKSLVYKYVPKTRGGTRLFVVGCKGKVLIKKTLK